VADTFGHWAGWFYIQQAATGVAADLLGARPGERILDLCAAPGGKTLHIAETMEGRGSIVATEVNEGRIRALLGNIYRLGTPNILVISGDGRELPDGATFDRVLVDVPCSAQGTVRKKAGRLPARSRGFMSKIIRAQDKLLRRAIHLTRPGGVVLYVTCTFGPDENEAVVSRVLADAPVDVEPMDPPVPHARGVTRWGEEVYDPRMTGAVRIYPHHLDSGGLFLCRLRKQGPDRPTVGWTPVPAVYPDGENDGRRADEVDEGGVACVEAALEILTGHYGVAEDTFAGFGWMRRGTNLWLHALKDWPVDAWDSGGHWRTVALGLRAFDLRGDGPPRPTNDLLQWLDDRVTRNRADLSAARWRDVLDGRATSVPGVERGHVALGLATEQGSHIVGWGFVRDGRLKDHIPSGRRNWLRSVVTDRPS
jgi:precorrin-6B methylase 2